MFGHRGISEIIVGHALRGYAFPQEAADNTSYDGDEKSIKEEGGPPKKHRRSLEGYTNFLIVWSYGVSSAQWSLIVCRNEAWLIWY